MEVSDAAVNSIYLIANEIAVPSMPFSDWFFVKNCLVEATENVCPEKRKSFANISLTRNTISDRISDLTAYIDYQLQLPLTRLLTLLTLLCLQLSSVEFMEVQH